jgi:hypothetical protein
MLYADCSSQQRVSLLAVMTHASGKHCNGRWILNKWLQLSITRKNYVVDLCWEQSRNRSIFKHEMHYLSYAVGHHHSSCYPAPSSLGSRLQQQPATRISNRRRLQTPKLSFHDNTGAHLDIFSWTFIRASSLVPTAAPATRACPAPAATCTRHLGGKIICGRRWVFDDEL